MGELYRRIRRIASTKGGRKTESIDKINILRTE